MSRPNLYRWLLPTALGLAASLIGCSVRSQATPTTGGPVAPVEPGVTRAPIIDGQDLAGVPAVQIEELIEGRVAGVRVLRTSGGGFSVQIRGPSTFVGNTDPLYVIDGMPVQVTPGRGIDWLNPGDIERIEILKDASDLSMYGVRGGNGVIRITTRRGES